MAKWISLGIAAAVAAIAASPAQAQTQYVTGTYSGTVGAVDVYDGDTGNTFSLGEKVSYSVTFDLAKLKDFTTTTNATLRHFYGMSAVQFASVQTASLSDDQNAQLSITVGGMTFSKMDQINYGQPTSDTHVDLGSGNFPIVEYLNGSFAGIGGVFRMGGITLYTDPIAAANGTFQDNFGVNHDFELDDATSDGQGNYDKPAVLVAAVPEPASLAMMIGGFGVVGGMFRRRRAIPAYA